MPNKYLRQHVTSFLNDTSYIHSKKTVQQHSAAESSLQPTVKSEPVVTAPPLPTSVQNDSEAQQEELTQRAQGQVVRMMQLEAERNSTSSSSALPSHNYTSRTSSGQNIVYQQHTAGRQIAGDQSAVHSETSMAMSVPPPQLPAVYQQVANVKAVQSQSAPSLISHRTNAEYVF